MTAVAGLVVLAALGAAEVKPLFGFERDAVARFEKLEVDTPAAYAIHNSFAGRTGDVTEGRWALVRVVPNSYGFLGPGNRTTYYNLHRIGGFLNTFGWFSKAMPTDWSDFSAFRVDVKSDSVDLKVLLELEDAAMADLVVRRYALPAGKWVALEVDLAEAQKRLGLDLRRMVGLRLMATEMAQAMPRTIVRVDNLRLVQAGAPDTLPVLRDQTPMAPLVRTPGPTRPLGPIDLSTMNALSGKVGVIDLARDPKWRKPDYPLLMVKERCLGGFGTSGVLLVNAASQAHLSLDGGLTWKDGGRSGLVGEEGGGIPQGPYLAEWGTGVACFWRQAETLLWARAEGDRWTPAERVRGREVPLSVVSASGSLFLAVTRSDAVLRYDGRAWVDDSPPSKTGLLARCGDEVVCVAANQADGGTAVVLCRRRPGGKWDTPRTIAVETEPVEGLAVPQVSPGGQDAFLPIAWSPASRRAIKVLAVPLRQ